jgi:hypothetical protein
MLSGAKVSNQKSKTGNANNGTAMDTRIWMEGNGYRSRLLLV